MLLSISCLHRSLSPLLYCPLTFYFFIHSNAPTEAEDEEEEFDEDHGSSSFSMKQDKAEDSDEEASEVGIGTKEKIGEFTSQSDALGGTYGATPGLSGVIEGVPG